jgi:multiple sugar transport system substrate-binding protein
VPISSPVLVLYYRSDLLQKAGLSPPETWDDYQKLLDSMAKWAPGLSAVEPWGEEFRATMFLARAAGAARPAGQYSFFFDVETGEPIADSPAFAKVWDQARAALAKMPEDVVKLGPEECRRRLLAGDAALAISWESPDAPTGSSAEPSLKRKEGIEIGFAPLPGARSVYNRGRKKWEAAPENVSRTGLTGFRGLGAGVSSAASESEQQAAWNLLATLIAPGNLEAGFAGSNRSPCRTSQMSSASTWAGAELSSAEATAYLAAVEVTLRDSKLSAELPVPGASEFRRILTDVLTLALTDEKSGAETMAEVQEKWRDAAGRIGSETIRETYRRRLGLPAK